jgi:predicted transposase YbfD/YdcC
MSAANSTQLTLRECFEDFDDPRRDHGKLHALWDIIGLTICGITCGCDHVTEIEDYGLKKQEFLETFLELENGIPSNHTIGRVFSLLDPERFRECFSRWVSSLAEALAGRHIAIDGKTLRRSYEQGESPLHTISAFASDNRLVLSQREVAEKSNEITAIPELLRMLDVRKAVVTIDAMGCQKEIAAVIKERGADYVLSLKENQPKLHEDVAKLFADGSEVGYAGMKHQECRTQEKGHGREETRTYHQIQPSKAWLEKHPEWKGLKTLGMVYRERRKKGEEKTAATWFYISSLSLRVEEFARAVRSHWRIENQLHWILDIGYREDDDRTRKDHAPANLAWIRRVTASLLAQEKSSKRGIKSKRKLAGWDDEFLQSVASRAVA